VKAMTVQSNAALGGAGAGAGAPVIAKPVCDTPEAVSVA
jgi:hypothetical protein